MLLGLQVAFGCAMEGCKVLLETCLQVGWRDKSKLKPAEACAEWTGQRWRQRPARWIMRGVKRVW